MARSDLNDALNQICDNASEKKMKGVYNHPDGARPQTIGDFRQLIDHLPDDMPLDNIVEVKGKRYCFTEVTCGIIESEAVERLVIFGCRPWEIYQRDDNE